MLVGLQINSANHNHKKLPGKGFTRLGSFHCFSVGSLYISNFQRIFLIRSVILCSDGIRMNIQNHESKHSDLFNLDIISRLYALNWIRYFWFIVYDKNVHFDN